MLKTCALTLAGGLLAGAGAALAQTVSFAPVATYSTGPGSAAYSLAAADLNGDNKLDLVTANGGTHTAGVLLGNGDGTFQAVATYATGVNSQPNHVLVADVNGDGRPDLLTANLKSSTVGVLVGNGNGTFQAVATYSVGAGKQPLRIALADMNSDGRPDVLAASSNSPSLSVLLGTGTGAFQPATAYATGIAGAPHDIKVADVNKDGYPDVLTVNGSDNTASVLLGTRTGTLQTAVNYPTGPAGTNTYPFAVAVADVNHDGSLDLLTANSFSYTVGVILGNGNGTFQAAMLYSAGANNVAYDVATADVNGDGQPDLLVANSYSNSAGVLLNSGTGTFQPPSLYATGASSQPPAITAGDVNGDGKPDLLTVNYGSGTVGVLLNTTSFATLATRTTLPGARATLHPNPATAATTLTLAGLPAAVAQVQATLVDATGRVVRQQVVAAVQASAQVDMPTVGLAAGFYILRLVLVDAQGSPAGSLPAQRLSVR